MIKNKELINTDVNFFSSQNIPSLGDGTNLLFFKKGQTIFYTGHVPYGLFILLSGEVELKYTNKKKRSIKANGFLGLNSFLNKEPYSCTATALTDCKVYFLSNADFQKPSPLSSWIKNSEYLS